MQISNCKPEELSQVVDLLKKTDLFDEICDKEDALLKKLQHDPESIILLHHDGMIVGMAMFIYDPWASFMWHLAIDPAYQGQGLGHLLAQVVESRLWARGTTSVNGYVLLTNTRSFALLKRRCYTAYKAIPVIPVSKIL